VEHEKVLFSLRGGENRGRVEALVVIVDFLDGVQVPVLGGVVVALGVDLQAVLASCDVENQGVELAVCDFIDVVLGRLGFQRDRPVAERKRIDGNARVVASHRVCFRVGALVSRPEELEVLQVDRVGDADHKASLLSGLDVQLGADGLRGVGTSGRGRHRRGGSSRDVGEDEGAAVGCVAEGACGAGGFEVHSGDGERELVWVEAHVSVVVNRSEVVDNGHVDGVEDIAEADWGQ